VIGADQKLEILFFLKKYSFYKKQFPSILNY
jgi:hypothetical protein